MGVAVADVKAKRPPVDWESVEREYRAGIRSLADIGAQFGVSAPGILKKAKAKGWERDLSAKIRAKAEAKVNAALVNESVNAEAAINEKQIIETNSEMMAGVIRGHHKLLARLCVVIDALFERLESELLGSELFSQLGELMAGPDDNGVDKLNELYRKVIALPTQTDTAKKLAETLKTYIELERKVFKIEEYTPGGDSPVARIELVALGPA